MSYLIIVGVAVVSFFLGAIVVHVQVKKAADFFLEHGTVEGAHHKMWVIDQGLAILLGEAYHKAIQDHLADGNDWNEGVAP